MTDFLSQEKEQFIAATQINTEYYVYQNFTAYELQILNQVFITKW